MNNLLETGTTEELLEIFDVIGPAAERVKQAHKESLTSGCIPMQGGISHCPPEGGWQEYDPNVEEFAKELMKDSAFALLLAPVGPMLGPTEGFSAWVLKSIVTNIVKRGLRSGIEYGIEELTTPPSGQEAPPLTTDYNSSPWNPSSTTNDNSSSWPGASPWEGAFYTWEIPKS